MRHTLLLVLAAAAWAERVDRDADGVPDAAPGGIPRPDPILEPER